MRQFSETSKRVFTAAVAVPIVIACLTLLGRFGVVILFQIISLALISEFALMVFADEPKQKKIFSYIGSFLSLISTCILIFIPGIPVDKLIAASAIVIPIIWSIQLLAAIPKILSPEVPLKQWESTLFRGVFGLIYCVIFPMTFVAITYENQGMQFLVCALLTVWSGDTGAYFGGRKYGKSTILPSISPKKSWEGLLFGSLAAAFAAQVSSMYFLSGLDVSFVWALGLFAFLLGQVGDFLESLIKRARGVKDSGRLLPGHGGFMDRLDSLLFVVPFLYLFICFF